MKKFRSETKCAYVPGPGTQIARVYEYIQQEKVGDQLQITTDKVRVLAEEMGVKPRDIWSKIGFLEGKGIFFKERLPFGQGLLLKFDVNVARAESVQNIEQPADIVSEADVLLSTLDRKIEEYRQKINEAEDLKRRLVDFLRRTK